MHIYNFKLNKNKIYKGILLICILICVIIFFYSAYHLFRDMKNYNTDNFTVTDSYFDSINSNEIPSNQYTNVLKEVHDNLNNYIGKEICFVGYIYRIDYLEKNQFVLARNMIINSASQSVVVGFLCELEEIDNFQNLSWVKVTGTIEKGYLDGEIPIIKVTNIENTSKPEEEFVYPPDDTYVQTSTTLY